MEFSTTIGARLKHEGCALHNAFGAGARCAPIGQTLDHRMSLGGRVLCAIVKHRKSGNDDHALAGSSRKLQRALMITVFDAAGEGSGKSC